MGRDLKLVDQGRLLGALSDGDTGLAAPGVRKAMSRSRSRREQRPMAQDRGCRAIPTRSGSFAPPPPCQPNHLLGHSVGPTQSTSQRKSPRNPTRSRSLLQSFRHPASDPAFLSPWVQSQPQQAESPSVFRLSHHQLPLLLPVSQVNLGLRGAPTHYHPSRGPYA